jgi:hypothetical protein
MGRGAKLDDICPHRPLETVLIPKHNDFTNRTSNENMSKAIFLYARNIHMAKDQPEFEYLTLDTMEIVTRGAGISFEPDTNTIEKINKLAIMDSSKIFCPSFTKLKPKKN